MLAFIIRRALQAVGVLLAIGIIAFAMFRFAGDPVNQMVGAETPPEERLALREQLGLNAPRPVQFGRYLLAARASSSAPPTSSVSPSRRCSPSACRRRWSSRSAPPVFASCSAS
jgi:hypothetical protein